MDYSPRGCKESDTTEQLSPFPSLMYYNHLVFISRLAEMYLIVVHVFLHLSLFFDYYVFSLAAY